MKRAKPLQALTRSSAFRFGLQSGASFGLNLGLTFGLHEGLAVPEEAAFAIALVTVFAFNFVVGRYFVYRASSGHAGKQLALFTLASFTFRVVEYASFLVLHSLLGLAYLVAVVVTLCVSVVIKYYTLKLIVFARRPTAEPAVTARATS